MNKKDKHILKELKRLRMFITTPLYKWTNKERLYYGRKIFKNLKI